MAVTRVENERLQELLESYAKGKDVLKRNKERLETIESQILDIIGKDITTEFEGTDSYDCGDYRIEVGYKLTRTVNQAEVESLCKDLDIEPESIFSKKWDYSKTLYKLLPDEKKSAVDALTTTKRAKTSVKVTRR